MSNEAIVKRMIEKRNEEPEPVEEIPSVEGEYDLEEIEVVRLENIALKKERLRTMELELMGEQQALFRRLRDRLGVTDEYELGFHPQKERVRVTRRQGNVNGIERQKQ